MEHHEFVSRQYPRAMLLQHWSEYEHHHYDLGSQGAPLFEKAYDALAYALFKEAFGIRNHIEWETFRYPIRVGVRVRVRTISDGRADRALWY